MQEHVDISIPQGSGVPQEAQPGSTGAEQPQEGTTGAAHPVIDSSEGPKTGIVIGTAAPVTPPPQGHPHSGAAATGTPGVGQRLQPHPSPSPIITLFSVVPTRWLSE